ncbi:MAG TPA: non-homologous end-joining DNA ligase, partial [Pseudonocardiaceae bacterium]|nr:non-homologous end-joining DNA ligase [Pseudonocardiaceae bacterium]
MSDPSGIPSEVLDDILDGSERALLRPQHHLDWQQPMLATLTDRPFSDPKWIYERKLDGVRAVVVRRQGRTRLLSRTGKSMDAAYPELVEALDEQAPDEVVLDGEVVAFAGQQTSFSRLQSRIGLTDPRRARATGVPVYLYLFDILAADGHDLTGLPLRTRKRVLRAAFPAGFTDPVRFSSHRDADGVQYLQQACAWGWEGLIAKQADSRYQHGRSRNWLKFKCVRGQEFVIGGFTDPTGSRVGFGALLVGFYQGDRLRYAGKVGTGYDDRTLRSLHRRLRDLAQDVSP